MNETQAVCPRCGKEMKPEGPPFYGLICECGMGATYAFAVRVGAVPEIEPGDRQRAVEAYEQRCLQESVMKRILAERPKEKKPGPPKQYRHLKIPRNEYPPLEEARRAFIERYKIEGKCSMEAFLMTLADLSIHGEWVKIDEAS